MTSNVGAQQAQRYRERFGRGWRRWLGLAPKGEAALLEQVLHERFEPEWLNRIDRILVFVRVDERWLDALLEIELDKLGQRLARQGRSLHLEPSARAWLCREHDVRFGARALARRLRTELEPAIAECLLADPSTARLLCTCDLDRLQVTPHSW